MKFGPSRGWPIRLLPRDGELLSSCLARNAFAHGSTPYRFLALFWPRNPFWDRDFDRDPTKLSRADAAIDGSDWLDAVAKLLRIDRTTVEASTLAGYRVRLAGAGLPERGDTPLVLSAGINGQNRSRHALQFCPDCLEDDVAYFRKAWRLGFVVACEAHGQPMLDACGHCRAPVVPHRSMTRRLADCHLCGRSITGSRDARRSAMPPKAALALQRGLTGALLHEGRPFPGPWPDRMVFDATRCLIAASAADPVHARLRVALGLGDLPAHGGDRLRFEQARIAVRTPWLETVGAWMADWPRSFRDGADAAGLTHRTFARLRLPRPLAEEVARLPIGMRRDHGWKPVLDEPVLRRLRRRDPAAYRQVRAQRILVATGFAP